MNLNDSGYASFHKKNTEFYIKLLSSNDEGIDRYMIFIEQSSFAYAFGLLSLNAEHFSKIAPHVYAESSLEMIAQEIGRRFAEDESYHCKVEICEDIFLYGRAVMRALVAAEEIFAVSVLGLVEPNKYSKKELYDIFISFCRVKVLYMRRRANVMRMRYADIMSIENVIPSAEHRAYNNRIWKTIEAADVLSAEPTFLPTLDLATGQSSKSIQHAICRGLEQNAKTIFSQRVIRFSGMSSHSYVYLNTQRSRLNFAFTMGFDNCRFSPLILWPSLNEAVFESLAHELFRKIKQCGNEMKTVGEVLENKFMSWHLGDCVEMHIVCDRLIHTLLNIMLLRAFLLDVGLDYTPACFNIERSVERLMYGYAHNHQLERVFHQLLSPHTAPVFSIKELIEFMQGYTGNSCILDEASYRSLANYGNMPPSEDECQKPISQEGAELYSSFLFDRAMVEEIESYRISTGTFAPSLSGINYLINPVGQDLRHFLKTLYENERCRKVFWLETTVAHIPHFASRRFITPGCYEIHEEKKQVVHVQCFRFF